MWCWNPHLLSTTFIPMRAIQFTIDEELLRRLDADPEGKARGRSALLRRAVEEYLGRKRERAIRAAYRRGYREHPASEDELEVAPEARAWPDE